jgi:hypothetical protein
VDASRRTFLKLAAGTVAGAALAGTAGVSADAMPAASGSGRPVLPQFPRPERLDVADLTKLNGNDQALLTTLQGIVNRRQPRIWTLLATDGTDRTWLETVRLPQRSVDDPLSMVERYRQELSGAVVYDIDVPDSVNVATTLAGLRGAVIATPEQAESLQLTIVDDLRGRFSGPVDAYTWQLANLWPRCNHRMLTGIPGGQTVSVPGVIWTTLGKVDQHVHDASNKATYTFDLSGQLGATPSISASRTPIRMTAGGRRCSR